jgi:hypothetical protein
LLQALQQTHRPRKVWRIGNQDDIAVT